MFDYAKAAATAERLIANFGQETNITRPGLTVGNEWNPQPSQAATDYPVRAVDLGIKNRLIAGSLTQEAVRMALLTGAEPKMGDKITLGGLASEIREVNPLSPAGTVVLYEVVLTK